MVSAVDANSSMTSREKQFDQRSSMTLSALTKGWMGEDTGLQISFSESGH